MFKRFFAKLASYCILSILLSTLLMANAAYGAELTEPFGSLESIKENECIDPKAVNDGNRIFTILEEPILAPQGSQIEDPDGRGRKCYGSKENPDFYTCLCYRNTFSYLPKEDAKERASQSELLKECSPSAIELYQSHKDDKDARYACQEVQVLFCSGGTCLITSYLGMIYRFAATIVGVITVLVIIISSIQLSTAGGDSSAVDAAKRRILQSIAGLAVLFLSGLILNAINPNFFVS